MKIIINNEQTKNKELSYEENFWTGKKAIIYNGVVLTKVKKNLYEYKDGKNTYQFELKGNQIFGLIIKMFETEIELSRKLTWYEIIMSLMVFIPCILFGAVGGAIGGALGITNLVIIKQIDKWWLKLILTIQFAAISLLLGYIFAFLILKTFMIF